MLTLVDSQIFGFFTNRPDLGTATLLGSCAAAGIKTILVKGQTRFIKDIFVRNSDELWHLANGLNPSIHLAPEAAKFREDTTNKSLVEFQQELDEIYSDVFQDKSPRTFLNASRLQDAWLVFNGAVAIYRYYLRQLKYDDLAIINNCVNQILYLNPELIGFSLQRRFDIITRTIIGKVRENTQAPIVVGGTITPFIPEEDYALVFKQQFIDYLVIGAGDRALPELVDAVVSNKKPRHVTNLVYKDCSTVRINKMAPLNRLDDLPFPDFDQFDLDLYLSPVRVLPMQSARGCTWRKCAFCSHSTIYGKKYEPLSIERVVDMIQHLRNRYTCRHFAFHDEEIPPVRMRKIAQALIKEKIDDCFFHVYARLEKGFNNNSLLADLKRAGFSSVIWGLESGSQKILDLMNKGIDIGTAKEVLRKSSKSGITNMCFFIFGFPGETRGDATESFTFLEQNKASIDSVLSGTFNLSPHSPIFNHPEKWGVSMSDNGRYTVSHGMQKEEAKKINADFKAKYEFNYSVANPNRFQYFAPGSLTSRLILFLLNAHFLLDYKEINMRISNGRLNDIFPIMLGEIQWEKNRPVLTRIDTTRSLEINAFYLRKKRKLTELEKDMVTHADGSLSLSDILTQLCNGKQGTESKRKMKQTCVAFFMEMLQKRQCLGFGRSW